MISGEEAAQILIMMSQSQPPLKKQSVVEAIEREDIISFRLPQQKRRSFPIASSSSSSSAEASSSGTREPTPEWLLELMTSKNGTEPKKIIVKDLTESDVSTSHNRLSIPFSSIIDLKFLSPAEERIIKEDDEKTRKTGVDAKFVCKLVGSADPAEIKVSLRKWKMSKSSGRHTCVYNLVTGWNQVVKGCSLKMDDKICLWSFRSNGKLFFALSRSSDSKEMSSTW